MLVPLTDSTNPYAAMMLELIASHNVRQYPHSHVWRAPDGSLAPKRSRFSFLSRFFSRRPAEAAPAPSAA